MAYDILRHQLLVTLLVNMTPPQEASFSYDRATGIQAINCIIQETLKGNLISLYYYLILIPSPLDAADAVVEREYLFRRS